LDSQIKQVVGTGIPLYGDDIDTDQIVPSRFLTAITFEGMDKQVFIDARSALDEKGKVHPFSDVRFAAASILIVNRNFGCGSSREHAPQGLRRWGIRAIVGESFGEIFAANAVAVGMPCFDVTSEVVAELQSFAERSPAVQMHVDLVSSCVRVSDRVFPMDIGAGRRLQLLEGTWDATSVLLASDEAIDSKMRALGYAYSLVPGRTTA
jgi:3-isopropylmalate/(R)-2-methylmalate dehydratase small subunit